ncbi:MAG: FAD-dependent oxidoreductase [Aggregatilineales bacterium]
MARDVVVIGGGLSGLSAAYELEQAKIPYTLIEVKPRRGGSIESATQDGFIFDSGAMFHQLANPVAFFDFLDALNLSDAVYSPDSEHIAFTHGTGALIDALDSRITAPIMRRMAVSTLGELDDRFGICMENGMLLDAKAIIVAAPARYAERMFHTLVQEISFRLLNYRYDSVARLSFGYQREDATQIPHDPPPDFPITAIYHTADSSRVPDNGVIIQVGLRYDPEKGVPADAIGETAALFGWKLNPSAEHIGIWTEAEPAMWRDESHAHNMRDVRAMLPDGVVLVGNDYLATGARPRLDERIAMGRAGAREIIDYLAK